MRPNSAGGSSAPFRLARLPVIILLAAFVAAIAASIARLPRESRLHDEPALDRPVHVKAGESVDQEIRQASTGESYLEAAVNWELSIDSHQRPLLRVYECGANEDPLRESSPSVAPKRWLSKVRVALPPHSSKSAVDTCLIVQISAPLSARGEMRIAETTNPPAIAGAYIANGTPKAQRALWFNVYKQWSLRETAIQIVSPLLRPGGAAATLAFALIGILAVAGVIGRRYQRQGAKTVRRASVDMFLLILAALLGGALLAVWSSALDTPSDWLNAVLQGFAAAPAAIVLVALRVKTTGPAAPAPPSAATASRTHRPDWRALPRSVWGRIEEPILMTLNLGVLAILLLAVSQRLDAMETAARIGYLILGTYFALEVAATVASRWRSAFFQGFLAAPVAVGFIWLTVRSVVTARQAPPPADRRPVNPSRSTSGE